MFRSKEKKVETLIRRHLTADCLSRSDLIESKIRSTNNWSLLESQAFLCTVMPSYYLSGKMEQVRFPGWFGKNSQRNKSLRITGELYSHARTRYEGIFLLLLVYNLETVVVKYFFSEISSLIPLI